MGVCPGWKAGAVYVNRRNKNIIALVDRNLATNYTEFTNIEVFEFPSGDPVLDANRNALVLSRLLVSNDDIMFVGSAPGLTAAQVAALTYDEDLALTVAPDAVRKMDQIQVSVERAFDDWSALGSLVWTDLRGNFFSVNGYDNPIGIGAGAHDVLAEGLVQAADADCWRCLVCKVHLEKNISVIK